MNVNELLVRKILDLSAEGLMVVNKEGVLVLVNQSFETIHQIPAEQAIGHHVTEVIENTRMHIVAQTGIPETERIQRIDNHEYVVSRIPIIENGECIGVVGKIVFRDLGEAQKLLKRIDVLQKQLEAKSIKDRSPDTKFTFQDLVAVDPESIRCKNIALRAAAVDTSVLLMGESGVGKEVYAHSIHNLSSRRRGPFVRINCSAIQENLFESELFGYEEGSFTGAKRGGKKGKFELAHTGTIFLDEIGDMPLGVQSKLLRVLQEKEIDRIGSDKLIQVDVRIIAATNQPLWERVQEGRFRKDLYYRLNVIPIQIPPLRQRREDIPVLINVLWERLKKKHGIYHKSLDESAVMALEAYDWPGNVREMNNVLERAMTIVLQEEITADHIQTITMGGYDKVREFCISDDCSLSKIVEATERRAISLALARANNNRSQAAKQLGISRALLYKKMNLYGLQKTEDVGAVQA